MSSTSCIKRKYIAIVDNNKLSCRKMSDDSRNTEEVNSVTTPRENRTPTVSERQEQPKPEALAWAVGIQQALERLIEATTQNVASGRNPPDEPSQSQIQRRPELEK